MMPGESVLQIVEPVPKTLERHPVGCFRRKPQYLTHELKKWPERCNVSMLVTPTGIDDGAESASSGPEFLEESTFADTRSAQNAAQSTRAHERAGQTMVQASQRRRASHQRRQAPVEADSKTSL